MPSIDPRIKLRHLACFIETNRQGGVLPAAEALGLTQPAVSKSLAELEAILGVALFDRSRRKLALTDFGALFLRHANAAIGALRQGIDSVSAARSADAVVRLGALPTVEVEVVPQAVARFSAGPLACRVHVESGPSPHLLSLLRAGAIDFVVGRMPAPEVMAGLSFEHLYSEPLVLAVRPGHPLLGDPEPTLRTIEPFPALVPPREAIIRPTVESILLAAGIARLPREIETVSNSFSRAYALLTDAVWFISRSVVAADLETGALVALPIDMTASFGAIGITTRGGSELDLPTAALVASVREVVENR
ncbi:pca operon transcription factor PcaQ [Pelagibacterium sp. 26DY04]|uniref:pca operon transcription factor PcaQ n=1 Tax=Pelagibacterium sp. 26DY04 TaxID=2967130 RepID=UPI0028162571|nr:pca operon transcription factor PcaQ [Pelagibacterium sp. 26DY04]WMT87585.1 pca operon transcription factor PcaQ [Pelagibacterium sp. 26DY04]